MLPKVLYPKLSYKITGLCFQTHNELGHFAKEKQYADRFEQLLKDNNIEYKREIKIPFQLEEKEVSGNIADFLIDNKIILECKAKRIIERSDYHQVQRYLKATGKQLGIIVNFHERFLKPKRVLNYQGYNTNLQKNT